MVRRLGSLGEQAIELAKAGFSVFPTHGVADGMCLCGRSDCGAPGKHPRTKHGHRDATKSVEQLRMWWTASEHSNVALATGGGHVVLDIDPRNGGDSSLRELIAKHGPLPLTPAVDTGGGGQHYYFAVDRPVACKNGIFRGIDLKGDGGYVVAPPSMHVSGRPYSWAVGKAYDETPFALAPAWLLNEGPGRVERSSVVGGGRNNHLTSVAGRLRRNGASETEIFRDLSAINGKGCKPPLANQEVARIAASVSRYPVGAVSISELLERSGVASLTDESCAAERERALRELNRGSASLDALGRALLRENLIQGHGFSAATADATLRQPKTGDETQQGAAILFTEPQPWPDRIVGSELLDEVLHTITKHVVLPVESAVPIALWIVHTHAIDAAQITPRLAIISPEKRCGKSTLLKLLGALVRRPLPATNITASVLFRTLETHRPTLLIDEADTFLRDRDDVRGVLNAGHDRQNAGVPRCVGDDHEPRVFNTWGAVAFAGIGKQHDTLMDRSVVVSMKRRSPAEKVETFRRRQREALHDLHRRIAQWARDEVEGLRNVEPQPAAGLDDRAVDNWEPLLAIADAAGAPWPDRARAAARTLSLSERGPQTDAHGELLLSDIRTIFDEKGVAALPTKSLLDALLGLEERPWSEGSRGRAMTPRQLGVRLRRFGIGSRTVRDGLVAARSYVRVDFNDAFARYLVDETGSNGTSLDSQVNSPANDPSPMHLVTDARRTETTRDFQHVPDVTEPSDDDEEAYVAAEREGIQRFGS